MKRERVVRLNSPEPCGGRKPASEVTDRALRYRANSEECRPGARQCMWCGLKEKRTTTNPSNRDYYGGARPNIEVGHIDGDETNTTKNNLAWTCRPCNQRVAAAMKKAGTGRRTKQFNPGKRKPISDWREFAQALAITKGEAIGDIDRAVDSLKATGPRRRSEFQKDIWDRRKELYGPSGRKDGGAVPF